jgi:hypothetical protein
LQPEDWREREKNRLLFRSQVPDRLEAAYEIALGDGLVEQHLLKPEEQLELYRSHGTYDIPQNEPWTVYPAWSDAIVFVTPKGRGEMARYSSRSEVLSERWKVDLARKELTLDNVTYSVTSERALRWVEILFKHEGKWVSSADLEKLDPELASRRTDKLKKYLPAAVLTLIESQTGAGSRICLGRK